MSIYCLEKAKRTILRISLAYIFNDIMQSIINVLPFVRTHKKRNTRTCASSVFVEKTDFGDPPNFKDVTKETGDYCIRSSIELVKDKDVVRLYEGYDDNMDIIRRVESVCEKDIKMYGKESHACKNAKLFFIGPKEECDGRINITGKDYTMTIQSWQD